MIIKNMAYWRAKNSPLNKKGSNDDKEPKTIEIYQGGERDFTTFENPYTAYQQKNIPKKDISGVPLAGGKVYSPISGLQVSGPGTTKRGRKRTDKIMRGDRSTKSYMIHSLDRTDADKSGLPDVFETGMSSKIRKLGADKKNVKKKLTRQEKIKAYQKSQLTK